MHASFLRSLIVGLASTLTVVNVAFAAPLLDLSVDANVDVPCLLGCTTALGVLGKLHSKVSNDLSTIADLSASASVDTAGLLDGYNSLVDDLTEAVNDLVGGTDLILYDTTAYVNAVGAITGNILHDIMAQVSADLSVTGLDYTLDSLNGGLTNLVNNLLSDVGVDIMPLIVETTAGLQTDAQIGPNVDIFASLWALLASV
ncbi:hypothetical protein DACRYDRAFT_110334 [Dacryopinax primogenitus]|uniref:Uncharacterized protein n=1 Tax=Dacryopinax primogenitus (strain DJM 731) TaxID=1858805 RepID=M5G5H5_DACPD|nr:uncharacterized protein DACRYDRAFT_110334 [Dacryopinax primogenitus]EJT99007.1 hypothetical protein DACRYDRAFT_110334 [Dacryopinax primogenitus]